MRKPAKIRKFSELRPLLAILLMQPKMPEKKKSDDAKEEKRPGKTQPEERAVPKRNKK